MKLWAISDLHVGHEANRQIVLDLPAHPDDWLILAGDLGETQDDLRFVLDTLTPRFSRVLWVPGNHELWTIKSETERGAAKYQTLVDICRSYSVVTPEDPYPLFVDGDRTHLIAPLFLLYDYTFSPYGLTPSEARAWAREEGLECADEGRLHSDPYRSKEAWCTARCDLTEARLEEAVESYPGRTVLINHFPLRHEHAHLPLVPRFSIWCGTTRTTDWHQRFRADVVVTGHLHFRTSRELDGTRFEEVSLGYPREWRRGPKSRTALRQILPRI